MTCSIHNFRLDQDEISRPNPFSIDLNLAIGNPTTFSKEPSILSTSAPPAPWMA